MNTAPWTEEETDLAILMRTEGASHAAIGEELDRTSQAVQNRLLRARSAIDRRAAWSEAYARHVEHQAGWPKRMGDQAFVRTVLTEMLSAVRGLSSLGERP